MSTTTTSWILELVDKATAPLRAIENTGTSVDRAIEKLNTRISKLTTRSSALTRRLKGMGVAAGAFLLLSAGSVQFEEGMARANTMAEVGADQLESYKKQIQEIATVVPIAKTQLAEGLYNTISAGVPKENWISFLNDSSKAAVAGNAQLGIVVDATSSTIKAYGDSWDNANKVQDRFQKTVQLGQIPSLQALATALPRVTAVSSKLKVSQEELLSVFATASGVMGAPAEVATQFNAVLSAMLKPGAEATKMANKLGIAFDAKSIGRSGGLQNYIQELMPKIQEFADRTGITQEQIIGNLFGSQEAIKLVIGLGGELSSSFATNTNKLLNSTGAVQSGFDIMASITKSKLTTMRNQFGNTMDEINDALNPVKLVFFEVAGAVLGMVNQFMQSHPTLTKFIVIGTATTFMAVGLTTGITLLSVRLNLLHLKLLRAALSSNVFTAGMARGALAIWSWISAAATQVVYLAGQATGYILVGAAMLGSFLVGLVSSTAAMWGLNVAMYANPIGLIVLGIVAAIAVIVVIIKYWDKIKIAISKFTQWVKKNNPFEWLVTIIDKVFPGFREKIEKLKTWVRNLLLGVWESIKKVWKSIKEFFGFGEEEKEIKIKVTKSPNGVDIDTPNPTNDQLALGNNVTPTGGESDVVSGDGKGAKILNMSLDIINNFNLKPGDWKGEIDDMADQIVTRINDRLRDGAISLG